MKKFLAFVLVLLLMLAVGAQGAGTTSRPGLPPRKPNDLKQIENSRAHARSAVHYEWIQLYPLLPAFDDPEVSTFL